MKIFKINNRKMVLTARRELDQLDEESFIRLFLLEEPIAKNSSLNLEALVEAGLVRVDEGKLISDYRIVKIGDVYIVTDKVTSRNRFRVYPIFQDESEFFALSNKAVRNGISLDLCTGSGIHAIFSARNGARKVYCSDINPRTEQFVRLNAALNRVDDKLIFDISDLFEKYRGMVFDHIVVNPPFMPIPEPNSWFFHGSAGHFGADIIGRILKDLPQYLKPNGIFQMIAHSVGSEERVLVLELLKEYLSKPYKVSITHILNPKSIPLYEYTRCYKDSPNYEEWVDNLKKAEFNMLYFFTLTAEMGKNGFEERQNPPMRYSIAQKGGEKAELVEPYLSGGWEERLGRYHNINGSSHNLAKTQKSESK